MDANSTGDSQKSLDDLVEQVRQRLLALEEARIAGSKLASIVGQQLLQGQTFRDLLPDGVDRDTASFRNFVELRLPDVVKPTADRRGADILYDIVDSELTVIPEPGELWRAFVAVRPKLDLVVDRNTGSLSVAPHPAVETISSKVVAPVLLGEHKGICDAYFRQLAAKGMHVQQLEEILVDYTASSYAKWLKILRAHTPALDREWGEFRKTAILKIFAKRVQTLELGQKQRTQVLEQFANDAPGADRDPVPSSEATPVQSRPAESLEDQARHRLHAVVDRMTLEQMNALPIPFSLFPHDPQ